MRRPRQTPRRFTIIVVLVASMVLTALLLLVTRSAGATAAQTVHDLVPTLLGNALLALAVVPLVRRWLRNPALRALRPAPPLAVEGAR